MRLRLTFLALFCLIAPGAGFACQDDASRYEVRQSTNAANGLLDRTVWVTSIVPGTKYWARIDDIGSTGRPSSASDSVNRSLSRSPEAYRKYFQDLYAKAQACGQQSQG